MAYLLWIPAAIAVYATQAYLSKRSSDEQGWWWLAVWLVGAVPLWAVVSRYSRNVMVDGILFDLLIFFSYLLTFLALGCGESFGAVRWAGLVLVCIGFVLLKMPL